MEGNDKAVRNCDVGTAEEKMRRFVLFCRCDCDACPIGKTGKLCPEEWAQMPYNEEGGAKVEAQMDADGGDNKEIRHE